MPSLTPNDAAKLTGRSRRSIMRAIEAGELHARRDNHNRWQIEESALAQWAPTGLPKPAPTRAQPDAQPVPQLQIRVAVLEAELEGERRLSAELRQDRDALRQDRDAWRDQAQRQAAAPAERGRWWPFWR